MALFPFAVTRANYAGMQDTQGFPLVHRDLQQIEQLSQKLRGKARRIDAGSDSLAAARLLAQEGVSAQKYALLPRRKALHCTAPLKVQS